MREGRAEFIRHSDPEEEEDEFSEDQVVAGIFCTGCDKMVIFENEDDIGNNIERFIMEFANIHSSHKEIVILAADDDEEDAYHAIATMIRTN